MNKFKVGDVVIHCDNGFKYTVVIAEPDPSQNIVVKGKNNWYVTIHEAYFKLAPKRYTVELRRGFAGEKCLNVVNGDIMSVDSNTVNNLWIIVGD